MLGKVLLNIYNYKCIIQMGTYGSGIKYNKNTFDCINVYNKHIYILRKLLYMQILFII